MSYTFKKSTFGQLGGDIQKRIEAVKGRRIIGGTFTLSHGSVTSAPLRFNASQKTVDRTFAELVKEDAAVQAMRKRRAKR